MACDRKPVLVLEYNSVLGRHTMDVVTHKRVGVRAVWGSARQRCVVRHEINVLADLDCSVTRVGVPWSR